MARESSEGYFGGSPILFVATVLGLGTGVLMQQWGGPTGDALIDGALAVCMGLYVCSHPAVNVARALLLDLLPVSTGSGGHGPVWLVLNFSSVIAGWFAIVVGLSAFLQ
jgi:hypothetical protein